MGIKSAGMVKFGNVMSPRAYKLGRRKVAAEETRARIVDAARGLLVAEGGFSGFTVDAVARLAGVARMTVYYQFGSKVGLLEAVFDSLTVRRGLERLGAALRTPDPLDGLADFIAAFGNFWEADRLLIRRLRGLAALDPDFGQVWWEREERRREGLRVIVRRLVEEHGRPAPETAEEAVDVLHALIGFDTFDALVGTTRGFEEAADLVGRIARDSLGLGDR